MSDSAGRHDSITRHCTDHICAFYAQRSDQGPILAGFRVIAAIELRARHPSEIFLHSWQHCGEPSHGNFWVLLIDRWWPDRLYHFGLIFPKHQYRLVFDGALRTYMDARWKSFH